MTLLDGLVCREVRTGSAEATILWIHGLGESGLGFEALLDDPRLARWNHLAPDLPGYGRSPWPDRPLGLIEHAHRLAALAEREIDGPWIVVGHSMGGVIGQILSENRPAELAGFVNVEGNLSFGDCSYSSLASPFTPEEFVEGGLERIRRGIFDVGIHDRAHRSYFVSCSLAQPETFHLDAAELVALSNAEELARRFAALDLPRRFAQGHPDGAPQRSIDLLREAGVEPRLFEPAGHWPFIDRRDEFVEWLAGEIPLLLTGS